ncbi:MAG: hypothetical protein IKU97_01820 [Tidjanibacter sp.]|nr:hypothetical protein [Tidjanibacter sp.]
MYDFKALKRIIIALGIAFVAVLAILLYTCRPLGGFAIISAVFMAVIALYLLLIPHRLIKEMQDLEERIEMLKKNQK